MISNLLNPTNILAQIKLTPKDGSSFTELTSWTPERLVSGFISTIMIVVGLAFFVMLVLGGLKWVVSEGEKGNVESARNQVTNALIGLAIVFSAWAILSLISQLTGVKFLDGFVIQKI